MNEQIARLYAMIIQFDAESFYRSLNPYCSDAYHLDLNINEKNVEYEINLPDNCQTSIYTLSGGLTFPEDRDNDESEAVVAPYKKFDKLVFHKYAQVWNNEIKQEKIRFKTHEENTRVIVLCRT